MRTSTIVLSITLLACAATALWYRQQLLDSHALNRELRARLATLEQRPEPARETVLAEAPAAASVAAAVATEVKPAVPPRELSSPTPSKPPATSYAEQQRQLLQDPRYRAAFRAQQRQLIEFSFRDLPRVLGLPPEKAAAVFDLMADQAVQMMELQGTRATDDVDGRKMRRAFDEQRRADDAQMAELIGPSNMAHLQEFRNSFSSRVEVNQLRTELAGTPYPLRDDQVEPMVAIVYAEQQRLDQEMRDFSTAGAGSQQSFDAKRTELAVAANRRIVETARPILSGGQLAALEDLYRRQRLQMETQSELTRLQIEAMTREAQARGKN